MSKWLQIRGDPSIRNFLYQQERQSNEFDLHIDEVLDRVNALIVNYGVFHAKVHFSSGQVTLWRIDDPLRYIVLVKDEFLRLNHTDISTPRTYSEEAMTEAEQVNAVLAQFKRLRTRDPQIYLRSGSLNVINGLVGLNFSCDGSHYVDYEEFLTRVREIC